MRRNLYLMVILVLSIGPCFGQVTNDGVGEPSWKTSTLRERPARRDSIWANGVVGEGFRYGAKQAGFSLGAGPGFKFMNSQEKHDLALARFNYGFMFTDVVAKGKWYQGNWEILGELFGGGQFSPSAAYVVGLSPVVRYNFITGTRWVPFLDGAAGIAATDIRHPDLSTTFEFNLHGGPGVHYFWRDNVAFTFQHRVVHFSNAGIEAPNLGVYVNMFSLGVTWFF